MVVGPFADDGCPADGAAGDESVARPYDARFVRAIKRRGWTGGGLAATELVNWFGHNPVVQSVAHIAGLPFAVFLVVDVASMLMIRFYRWARRKIIIIDLSGTWQEDPRRGDPRFSDDRPDPRK